MHEAHAGGIALIGLMGAGKTTVGRLLATRLGMPFLDLDAWVEEREGASVAALFASRGEAAFRALEREALAHWAGEGVGVLACGGGVVLDPANRRLLASRFRTVWLEVSPAEAAQRIGDGATRPLVTANDPKPRLDALHAERASLYAGVARLRIATDGRTPEQVADDLVAALEALRS